MRRKIINELKTMTIIILSITLSNLWPQQVIQVMLIKIYMKPIGGIDLPIILFFRRLYEIDNLRFGIFYSDRKT